MDLTQFNISSSRFKAPPVFPKGTYRAIITDWDFVPFYWSKRNLHGLAYVPTFRCTESIEANNQADPEAAADQLELLEAFGDWKSKLFTEKRNPGEKFLNAWRGEVPPEKIVYFGETVFPLAETDDEGNFIGALDTEGSKFHLAADEESGRPESGFIHDVLGLSYPDGEDVTIMAEATTNQEFIVRIDHEPSFRDPSGPPNPVIAEIGSVPQ